MFIHLIVPHIPDLMLTFSGLCLVWIGVTEARERRGAPSIDVIEAQQQ